MKIEKDGFLDLSEKYELSGSYVEITSKCNLRCLHCYNESGQNNDFLSKEAFINAIEGLPDNDHDTSITISGGEPFLHPEIWDFIDIVDQKNCGRSLVITNATFFDENTINKLAERHIGIQLSINGVTAESHDRLCGRGTYDKTINTLQRLLDKGLSERLHVRCMVYGGNKEEVIPFLQFMKDKGITSIDFASVTRMGRANKNADILQYSDKDKEMVTEKIGGVKKEYENQGIHFSYPDINFSGGCPILATEENKKTQIVPRVDARGNVHLCQAMSNDTFSFGNVYRKTLSEIIKGDIFSKFIWYCRFGVNFMSSCEHCVWNSICAKGCIALILNNSNFETTDGDCYFRKKAIMDDFQKNANPLQIT